jgi:hypothetical protein
MTRDQLEHAIRAACNVAHDTELIVFGSQAILGSHPDPPATLAASIEVDVQPKNRPDQTDAVDGVLGELSQFHETHGFYVHGVSIESAVFPEGWISRTVRVSHPERTEGYVGHCIEAHDLAASKLAAYREKDRIFVSTLLREDLIDVGTLLSRVDDLPIDVEQKERLSDWIRITAEDLGSSMD